MTRHHAQLWMLWLLPLLLTRLLLPTGVMPARSAHGVALVLCSWQHHRSAPDQNHSHADAPCPFAAAATAAAPATPILPGLAGTLSTLAPSAGEAQCFGQTGAARSQSARAPPSFS
jgi:hypothetical protein